MWTRNKNNYSQIRMESEWKTVLKQQAIYVGGLVAFYGVYFILLASGLYSSIARFIWGVDTSMYWFIVDNLGLILFFLPILIFIYLEIRMVIRKERTINQLIRAIESLYNKDIEEVKLPAGMDDVQSQIDNIRLQQEIDEQRAKEAEQKKNDLIVYLAHDLKTPLTSVIGYLTLLNEEEEISGKLQKKYQGIALDKAYRLEDLTNEFFEITRYNLQTMELEKANLNLSYLLQQLAEEFYPLLKEKNQEIELEVPKDLFIMMDGTKMARVFDNVLKNAVSYGNEDSVIKLVAKAEENEVIVTVSNQGIVIPSHKLQLIFDKFYRLDESRSSSNGGSGLGLAVAKKIVELHDGSIEAESSPEETVFTIRLRKS